MSDDGFTVKDKDENEWPFAIGNSLTPKSSFKPHPPFYYRPSDLAVGDRVIIAHHRVGDINIAQGICIQRRPGGRVPPAPGNGFDGSKDWHERMNAEQDWEEKGIPLPEKIQRLKQVPGTIGGIPIPKELMPKGPVVPFVPAPMPDPKPPATSPDRKQTDN